MEKTLDKGKTTKAEKKGEISISFNYDEHLYQYLLKKYQNLFKKQNLFEKQIHLSTMEQVEELYVRYIFPQCEVFYDGCLFHIRYNDYIICLINLLAEEDDLLYELTWPSDDEILSSDIYKGLKVKKAKQYKILHIYEHFFFPYRSFKNNDPKRKAIASLEKIDEYLILIKQKADEVLKPYEDCVFNNFWLRNIEIAPLRIDVDYTFNALELGRFLNALTRLHSLIQYLYEHGLEESSNIDIEEMVSYCPIVLDCIHIASPGVIAGVVAQIAGAVIVSVIPKLTEDNTSAASKSKAKLDKRLEDSQTDEDSRKRIDELMDRLEKNIKRRNSGSLPKGILDQEIQRDFDEIKKLQGKVSIDIKI